MQNSSSILRIKSENNLLCFLFMYINKMDKMYDLTNKKIVLVISLYQYTNALIHDFAHSGCYANYKASYLVRQAC